MCSIFYYIMILVQFSKEDQNNSQYITLGTLGIQMRNLLTFLATTTFTLYNLYFRDEMQYTQDNRISSKLMILNLEVIMTHQLPFNYFREFVINHSQGSVVYLNLYCLIELYRKKLQELLIQANMLKRQSQDYDMRCISELRPLQIQIGRKMINILMYIEQQSQYFKGLKVCEIETFEQQQLETQIQSCSDISPKSQVVKSEDLKLLDSSDLYLITEPGFLVTY